MLSSRDRLKPLILSSMVALIGLTSCAYYNTFYNAEEYFAEAQKVTRENQSETVSRDEINLYSKAIEKSKKLLTNYPDSKYRDDAQFIIAKSYYFKGDYLLAKRYFEDLTSLYSNSPHTDEVPLWIGRCLVKTGDLEMARYEASRVLRSDANRGLQADALLLMGEIAVQQDSLELAEDYLVQVIERSPDGFTKAQAQFQVGRMRENKKDYDGALSAYETVSRYKPSESLKVEAIIRQTSMLKALNRDEDAVEMIQDMLLSDKFVEIRGQLEVELGKLYLVMNEVEKAKSKFTTIVEDYNRTDVSAEASYYLGELYLTKENDYKEAKTAFANVKTQSARSPLVNKAVQRNKQIERYQKIQLDYTNHERGLAGLPPMTKAKKNNPRNRNSRTSARGRAKGGRNITPEQAAAARRFEGKKEEVVIVEVSSDDSLRIAKHMEENRYSLAEYMLFEFTRVDTTLELLTSLETSTLDSSMKHQSAYMQYYAIESIRGDSVGGQAALRHIENAYPLYYQTIMNESEEVEEVRDPNEDHFNSISTVFEGGDTARASRAYLAMMGDSTVSKSLRSKSCFNHAWLNDHYLFDKTAAIESYTYMVDHFADDPLAKTARNRLKILSAEPESSDPETEEQEIEEGPREDSQDSGRRSERPSTPKEGEKGRGNGK